MGSLGISALKERARSQAEEALHKLVVEKVEYIASGRCWPINVADRLEEINEGIQAGKFFGITQANLLTADEIKTISEELKPFIVLKMTQDLEFILREVLCQHGLEVRFLGKKVADTQSV